jgi:predicted RNase H-like HicB family nuclease
MSTDKSRRSRSANAHRVLSSRAYDEPFKVGNQFVRCRIRNEPDGGYMVTCPGLVRGVFGKTLADACTNAREMVTLWLDALDEAERRALQSRGPD